MKINMRSQNVLNYTEPIAIIYFGSYISNKCFKSGSSYNRMLSSDIMVFTAKKTLSQEQHVKHVKKDIKSHAKHFTFLLSIKLLKS